MSARAVALPGIAAALVGGVLAVQVAYGGGSFEPLRPRAPCAARTVVSQSEGIEALTERLVLIAVDRAACRLDVSREAFLLDVAGPGVRSDAEVDALRAALHDAVAQMKADDTLPPASDLVDEALDAASLNGLLEAVIRALPDSAIDAALRTDDVLDRAIDDLDLRALLADLDDQDELEARVEVAVSAAVTDSLVARVRDLI
ncbi:hypothetical protein [Nocardioides sp. T2.26MG-1]|uniref:hypothetical protein n=1 Tax=Nocardioides sp. T2.26MG-1 TaxID=3041166 RepID=UPI002477A213|nr:hypothetical protein [Nocardioides sp. T2.26MG-1]CAI9413456.1 hypothetical protein HIDPHFAB_02025 [Nocardioides sp. T2.26MG-1]